MMAKRPADHIFARRARERPLKIIGDAVLGPKGDGSHLCVAVGRCEFGDEGVLRVNRARQMPNQRPEELFTGAVSSSFDNGAECGNLFCLRQRWFAGFAESRSLP